MNPNYKPPYIKRSKSGKTPRALAKIRAWKSFSRWVRLRDAIKTTGTKEWVLCCTCGKKLRAFGAKNMGEECADAGHCPYIEGRADNVLFIEKGVHAQCTHCNQYHGGKPTEYYNFMMVNYNAVEIEEIRKQRYVQVKYYESDFQEIHLKYKKKYKELQEKLAQLESEE